MDAYKAIISLRAKRHFKKKNISEEKLSLILEAGRWTGSAKNFQPWHFLVISHPETLQELSKCGFYASHMRSANKAIVVVTDPNRFGSFDSGRAAQNMMLAAWILEIGSCIATLHNEDQARKLLHIPQEKQIQIAISFGYPIYYSPLTIQGLPREKILHNIGRRSIEEIVHWEKW